MVRHHYWWALFGGRLGEWHLAGRMGAWRRALLKAFVIIIQYFYATLFLAFFLLFDIEAWSTPSSARYQIPNHFKRFLCFRASRSADLSQRILESICDGLASSQSPDSKHSFDSNSLQLDFIQWCGIVIPRNGSQMQRHENFYFSPPRFNNFPSNRSR